MSAQLAFGLIIGMFMGLGLALFFRWSEDNYDMTFAKFLEQRELWVQAKNKGKTDISFDAWMSQAQEEKLIRGEFPND